MLCIILPSEVIKLESGLLKGFVGSLGRQKNDILVILRIWSFLLREAIEWWHILKAMDPFPSLSHSRFYLICCSEFTSALDLSLKCFLPPFCHISWCLLLNQIVAQPVFSLVRSKWWYRIMTVFTFVHLADAFIQSELQCIQAICFLSVCVFSGIEPTTFCIANTMLCRWVTGRWTIANNAP